jgi:DnaJ family protein C protein 28
MPNIEDHIQKAMQDGQFDNLAGKGKPVRLEENPFVDPDWRLSHHMLKSSGFTLPWIEKRQEILEKLSSVRIGLANSWHWRQNALNDGIPVVAVDDEWLRALAAFGEQIEALNQKIFTYNLEVPSDHFQLAPLNFEREVAALTTVTG